MTIELTAGSGNSLPSFGSATIFREVSENQPRGTDVGAPVAATDANGEELSYGLAGTDVLLFRIDGMTGQIETRRSLDHEARQSYALMVSASDGTDTTTVELTIRVLDEDEPPGRPGQPTVRPVDGSVTSLLATWFRAVNVGRPLVSGYDVQYRKEGDPDWADGPRNVPFPRAEIGGLEPATVYEVQVRAVNAEGEGPWSVPGSGETHAFTVRVAAAPGELRHDGENDISVVYEFSEALDYRGEIADFDDDLSLWRAGFVSARRLSPRQVEVTFKPSGQTAFSVLLRGSSEAPPCMISRLCTEGGVPLAERLIHWVAGPRTEVVSIRAVSSTVDEGDPAVFELTRSPGDEDSGAQEIRLDLLLEGDPFVDAAPWTVTFEADAATASLSLATKKDDAVEDGRRILYRVRRGSQAPPAYLVGSPAEAMVTVRDDDSITPPPPPPPAARRHRRRRRRRRSAPAPTMATMATMAAAPAMAAARAAAERPGRRSRWPRIARTASAAP